MIHPADHPKPPNRDRECLVQWSQHRCAESLRPLVECYGPLVFARSFPELGNIEGASAATRAVFIALARRKTLPGSTVIAEWLFRIAGIADGKSFLRFSPAWWRRWFPRRRTLDEAIDRLRRKPRNA